MYQFESRIRYSETGEDGCLTLTGMLNYLQDCSIFQSEDMGVGVNYLDEVCKAWMLSAWRIRIMRYPRQGERVAIGTWHYGQKGIYGYRNFIMEDAGGKRLAEADSRWFLLDLRTGLPSRVRPEDIAPYGTPSERLPMEAAGRVMVPPDYVEGRPVTIARHQIDTNHHVNNAQYVEIAREAAGINGAVRQLHVDYKKAAVLGDVLYPGISRQGRETTVVLHNDRKEVCAAIWMEQMEDETISEGEE